MTKTKRKRLLAEAGTSPGDLVVLNVGYPILKEPGNYDTLLRWVKINNDVAILLAVCNPHSNLFFTWSLVFTMKSNTLGWVETKTLKPCP